MSRFEVTLLTGEKLVVEMPGASTSAEVCTLLASNDFAILNELRTGSVTREVIIASSGILLVRPIADGSTQGSSFISKR